MAPWCGHCQKLKPEWEDAARKLAGDFNFGVVDATQESGLAQRYDVKVARNPQTAPSSILRLQ
jgi:thioredoxin-like negative regulator of GroEL